MRVWGFERLDIDRYLRGGASIFPRGVCQEVGGCDGKALVSCGLWDSCRFFVCLLSWLWPCMSQPLYGHEEWHIFIQTKITHIVMWVFLGHWRAVSSFPAWTLEQQSTTLLLAISTCLVPYLFWDPSSLLSLPNLSLLAESWSNMWGIFACAWGRASYQVSF